MARHINAELIEKHMNKADHYTPDERWRPESEFAKLIDSIPTADVTEVVHGKWLVKQRKGDWGMTTDNICSACHRECWLTYKFCPNCGAKMDVIEVE